jgi:hypothetical protein
VELRIDLVAENPGREGAVKEQGLGCKADGEIGVAIGEAGCGPCRMKQVEANRR